MKKILIAAAATLLTAAGCAYDRECSNGWNDMGDCYSDGAVYGGGEFGEGEFDGYVMDGGAEHPVYLPGGATYGPEIIVPGGETIPVPSGQLLPEPAQ